MEVQLDLLNALKKAGIKTQTKNKSYFEIKRKISYKDESQEVKLQ